MGQLAKRQNYVNLDTVEKGVIDVAAQELDYVLGADGCDVEMTMKTHEEGHLYMVMNCTSPDFAADDELTTLFDQLCLVSDHRPFPNSTVSEGMHEKSLFCQCFAEFTDVTEQYYTPAKGIGIALVIFFFLTFLACCYLSAARRSS